MEASAARWCTARTLATGRPNDQKDAEATVRQAGGDEHARREVGRRDARLRAVEVPRAPVLPRRGRGPHGIIGPGLDERRAEHGLARRGRPQERSRRGAPEHRQRQRAEHERRPHRQGRHGTAHLLEKKTQLDEPEPAAARVLRDGRAEQLRPRELRPRLVIEPIVPRLDRLEPLVRHPILENPPRELSKGLLLGSEGEVHRGAS
jgi:hypothetical protein